ncbi:hypothetical protein BC834DRAFT_343103 [Gloeopeniophorella convolvens]|nr:hypothetical protein BC834DRAFT_343103 [Gloeopeniophorella convolvens]
MRCVTTRERLQKVQSAGQFQRRGLAARTGVGQRPQASSLEPWARVATACGCSGCGWADPCGAPVSPGRAGYRASCGHPEPLAFLSPCQGVVLRHPPSLPYRFRGDVCLPISWAYTATCISSRPLYLYCSCVATIRLYVCFLCDSLPVFSRSFACIFAVPPS